MNTTTMFLLQDNETGAIFGLFSTMEMVEKAISETAKIINMTPTSLKADLYITEILVDKVHAN